MTTYVKASELAWCVVSARSFSLLLQNIVVGTKPQVPVIRS